MQHSDEAGGPEGTQTETQALERLRQEALRVEANAECLYSREQVARAMDALAAEVNRALAGSDPLLLCVMVGGIMTTSMLAERLEFAAQIDYIHLGRYGDRTRGGDIRWHRTPAIPLRDRTVLIVDDILDEGDTLAALKAFCEEQGAASVQAAVLVEKQHDRRKPGVTADFVALSVDDRYVFGCGMDYKGYLRSLPAVYAVADSPEPAGGS